MEKGKACEEVDTSPIECVKPDPRKRQRDKEIQQSKGGIKASIGQRKDKREEINYLEEGETGL